MSEWPLYTALDEGWRDELKGRVSELLRREQVPPAALLEQCCAILDEAMRLQQPGGDAARPAAGSSAPFCFSRSAAEATASAAAPAAAEDFGCSLPLRSLQPNYPKFDARSQAFVDQYAVSAKPAQLPVDTRKAKIDALVKSMENAQPSAAMRREGTQIAGGFSRTRPLHQARFKALTLRPTDVAVWAMLCALIPELAHATELSIARFPAPGGDVEDSIDTSRAPDSDLNNTAMRLRKGLGVTPSFVDPVQVELTFQTGLSKGKPLYRKLTISADAANLIKDMDGEAYFDWHTDSFTRTAGKLYNVENGEPAVNMIDKRLQQQAAEKAARVSGASVGWRR